MALADEITKRVRSTDKRLVIVMYVDEAHMLADSKIDTLDGVPRLCYHAFHSVLLKLHALPMFTIFLSTNPHLHAPSPDYREFGSDCIPAPCNEMPWDVFPGGEILAYEGQKSLKDVCTLDSCAISDVLYGKLSTQVRMRGFVLVS